MAGAKNTINAKKTIHAIQVKVRRALMMLAALVEGAYRTEIRDDNGVYTGTLMGTITGSRIPTAEGVMAVQVGTPVIHGEYYEWGTRPHMPPFEPIRRWVELKLQPHVLAVGVKFEGGRALPTGRGMKLTGAKRNQEINRVARQIQLAIKAHGTKPHLAMMHALGSMHVPFNIVDEGGARYYKINAAAWLEQTNPTLLQQILATGGGPA